MLQQNVLSAVTLLSQDCRDIAAGQLSSYTSPEVDSEDRQQNLSTGSTDAEPLAVVAHPNPATGLKVHAIMFSFTHYWLCCSGCCFVQCVICLILVLGCESCQASSYLGSMLCRMGCCYMRTTCSRCGTPWRCCG